MSFYRAFIGSRVIETAENYTYADDPLNNPERLVNAEKTINEIYYMADSLFWHEILYSQEKLWGSKVHFTSVVLSEWVPRVPGLYWMPGSENLRKIKPETFELIKGQWYAYSPVEKSQQVMGGVGSLRLPPSRDGYRLAVLSSNASASTGIPSLISPEVWDKHKLEEGCAVEGNGVWQPMDRGWSSLFPITKGIPRGYLIITETDTIDVKERDVPTRIHPFSIMEYQSVDMELFDYVYVSASTGDPNYRQNIIEFFESYKDNNERFGKYLIAGDLIEPLWGSLYLSPEDLRRVDPAAQSQLSILKARVNERHLKGITTESLLKALTYLCDDIEDLDRISAEIIPKAFWYTGGTLAEACSQFIAEVVSRKKQLSLIDSLGIQKPEIILGGVRT